MNWKNLFQKHILERGYNYYEDGSVTQIKINKDEITAVVEGTYDYNVSIDLKNGIVTDMFCDCPYAEDGNNCKHMAAVLYAADEHPEDSIGKNSEEQEIEKLLEQANPETIKRFLTETLCADSKLLLKFKSQCDFWGDNIDLKEYEREINKAINLYSNRGFIPYRYADDFISEMENYLYNDVEKLIERDRYKAAFDLSCHVFLKTAETDMDDSSGCLGEFGCVCLDIWNKIILNSDAALKDEIFSWLLKHLDGSVIDYMEDYIESALMQNFCEKKYLEKKLEFTDMRLNKIDEKNDWIKNYQKQRWIMLHISIMEQLEYCDDEIFEYCKTVWELSAVQEYCIDKKISIGDYVAAIDILNESIELDKEFSGLIDKYRHKLKDIYITVGDMQSYKQQLWKIVTKSIRVDINEYCELKSLYLTEEWIKVREDNFSVISEHTAAPLYCEERMYDRLLKYVLAQPGIYTLEKYESALVEQYPEQVLSKYEEFLQKSACNTATRKTYRKWVGLLIHMKKIKGGKSCVDKIADSWRSSYSNRPAMMQELDKL